MLILRLKILSEILLKALIYLSYGLFVNIMLSIFNNEILLGYLICYNVVV